MIASKDKTVLVTGGAGFIGHALAKKLLAAGFSVKTFDLVEPDEDICEFVKGTIMYPEDLHNAMRGCSYVAHLAARLGVQRTEQNKMKCLDINIQGTKNVLDAAVKSGVKKIIFCSSSEVYGDPRTAPISEREPVAPKSVYGVTKLAGEEYVKAYHQAYGIDYAIVRPFNAYGPGQVAEFVIPRFARAVMEDEQPVVYGTGEQRRSFCYVDDVVEGIALSLMRDDAHGEIFNIGNDAAALSVADLARKVIALSGKDMEPKYIDISQSDRSADREIMERIPDIGKARRVLGYEPKVPLDEGLKRVLANGSIKKTWHNL